jgi:hypothetical protein
VERPDYFASWIVQNQQAVFADMEITVQFDDQIERPIRSVPISPGPQPGGIQWIAARIIARPVGRNVGETNVPASSPPDQQHASSLASLTKSRGITRW